MNLKKNNYILGISFLLLYSCIIWGGISFTLNAYKHIDNAISHEAATVVAGLAGNVSKELKSVRKIVQILSISSVVVNVFEGNELDEVNLLLDKYSQIVGDSVCYLMNEQGKVIASSNRDSTASFVGKSYAFRPYFKEAIKGDVGEYFAVGVTSLERGYYVGFPVFDKLGKISGVAVIKKMIDGLELNLKQNDYCFVINEDGIIFLSSQDDLVLKSLFPISSQKRELIQDSKQFGAGSLEALFTEKLTFKSVVTFRGKKFWIDGQSVARNGWQIVLFTSREHISEYLFIGVVMTILVLMLCLVFMILLYCQMKNKAALKIN